MPDNPKGPIMASKPKPTLPFETVAPHIAAYENRSAVEAAGYVFGAENVKVGDVAVVYSRDRFRRGVVVGVGRLNVTVAYSTAGAIDTAARYHQAAPHVTTKADRFEHVAVVAQPATTEDSEQSEPTLPSAESATDPVSETERPQDIEQAHTDALFEHLRRACDIGKGWHEAYRLILRSGVIENVSEHVIARRLSRMDEIEAYAAGIEARAEKLGLAADYRRFRTGRDPIIGLALAHAHDRCGMKRVGNWDASVGEVESFTFDVSEVYGEPAERTVFAYFYDVLVTDTLTSGDRAGTHPIERVGVARFLAPGEAGYVAALRAVARIKAKVEYEASGEAARDRELGLDLLGEGPLTPAERAEAAQAQTPVTGTDGCVNTLTGNQVQRQFCRKCLKSCDPAVTLTFNGGTGRLHWCADCTGDADAYRDQADAGAAPQLDSARFDLPLSKTIMTFRTQGFNHAVSAKGGRGAAMCQDDTSTRTFGNVRRGYRINCAACIAIVERAEAEAYGLDNH